MTVARPWNCLWMLAICGCAALSCTPTKPAEAPEVPWQDWTAAERRVILSLSPAPALAADPSNRLADDPRAAMLGLQLFFDKRLSGNGQVACATCHQPERWFSDGKVVAQGVATGRRNTPTLLDTHALPFLFADGRKDSLWSQALGPLEDPGEHGTDRLAVTLHIASTYRPAYEALFPALPPAAALQQLGAHARPDPLHSDQPHHQAWQALSPQQQQLINAVFANVGKLLAAYVRQLRSQPADFDRYVSALRDGRPDADQLLSLPARRGLRAFIGPAGCVNCHNGPGLTDKSFHNLGLPQASSLAPWEPGRSLGASQVLLDPFRCGSEHSDTKDCPELTYLRPEFEDFVGAFKTPSLRNVAQTAPYMHTGQLASLAEVLVFYRTLPVPPLPGHRDGTLRPLDTRVEDRDLEAFLRALTGGLPDRRWLEPVTAP